MGVRHDERRADTRRQRHRARAGAEHVTPEVSLHLPSDRRAAAMARHALDPLSSKVHPNLLDDMRLLVSELVTNSVRHVESTEEGAVRLEVSLSADRVRIEVRDRGGGFTPRARTEGQDEASGWGIFLVDQIAERWGVKTNHWALVWCELSRTDGRYH